MKNRIKRLTSLILAMAMCLSLLSANTWATEALPQTTEASTEVLESDSSFVQSSESDKSEVGRENDQEPESSNEDEGDETIPDNSSVLDTQSISEDEEFFINKRFEAVSGSDTISFPVNNNTVTATWESSRGILTWPLYVVWKEKDQRFYQELSKIYGYGIIPDEFLDYGIYGGTFQGYCRDNGTWEISIKDAMGRNVVSQVFSLITESGDEGDDNGGESDAFSKESIPDYPVDGQDYWIIFKEGYRNNRVELSTCNLNYDTQKNARVIWNKNLTIQGSEIEGKCNQYYYNSDRKWKKIGTYGLLTDWATEVIASNLDVYDKNGNLIVKAKNIYNTGDQEESKVITGKCGENATWSFDDNTGTLTINGTGEMKDYSETDDAGIPYIIEEDYRQHKDRITSVIIEEGITCIGENAFSDFDAVTEIVIPNSINTIREAAFSGCKRLSSISLPNNITSIEASTFEFCSGLVRVSIPTSVTRINECAFYSCTSLEEIQIPDSITILEGYAFGNCINLKQFTIPCGISRLEEGLFGGCGLTSVIIPDGVRYVNKYTFANCTSLSEVTIPKSVIVIGEQAFYQCFNLSDVNYDGSELEWNKIQIQSNNECLTNAAIHYNSTSPITEPSFTPVDAELVSKEDFEFRSSLNNDNNVAYSFSYADVWLMDDDPEFRYALMKTSIRVAQAAFTKNGVNADHEADNIKEMMTKMGYKYTESSIVYETPNINTIGSAIGMKNIKKADGSYQSLILIAIRGGGYGTEWGGNFNVGNDSKYHVGFETAANTVRGRLSDFMAENQENINNPIVWITGFSRGAATSNLLASYLIHSNPIEGINPQNVLAFCFECPKNVIDPNASSAIYDNIVNVVNPIDFVPKVAFNRWDFTRYGKTLYIPSRETTVNFESKYKIPMIWKYQDLVEYHNGKKNDKISLTDDHVVELIGMGFVGQASNLDALADEISSKISKDNYYNFAQDNMVEITANTLGGAGGKTDWYAAAVSMILAILAPRDAKDLVKEAIQLSLGKISVTTKIELVARASALAVHAPSVIKMFKNGSDPGPGPSAHYSELCMAWIDSMSGFSDYWRGENTWYRQHIINCPVDVSVRDHTGKVVGKVTNHQVEKIEDGVTAYVDENEQIVFALPMTEKYTVDVQATDNGSVDYMIQEVNGAEGTLENVITYQEIPVTQGDTITVQSDDTEAELPERYVLKKEDEENPREPDAVLTEGEVERFTVTTAVEGIGTVTGGGYVIKGEYVKVTAETEDGAQFLGWYEGDILVSDEAEYRFCVLKDTALVGKFTEHTHTYGAPKWNWSADFKSATAEFICKHNDDTQIVKATIHEKSTPVSSSSEGKTIYTATVTFQGRDYTDIKTINFPKTGESDETDSKPQPAPQIANAISGSNAFTKTANAKKAQSFKLGASANGAPLSYKSSNKNVSVKNGRVTIKKGFVGKAVITITAAETDQYFPAQKQVTVTVKPSVTQLSSVKWDKKKKTVTAAWKKNTTGKGYEVQYSTNKKFKKGVKTVKIKKNATVKTTVKKLKKGTWYFRLRTVNGKNVSGWSKVKTLKIAK